MLHITINISGEIHAVRFKVMWDVWERGRDALSPRFRAHVPHHFESHPNSILHWQVTVEHAKNASSHQQMPAVVVTP